MNEFASPFRQCMFLPVYHSEIDILQSRAHNVQL